jgi:hypothetical protein
MKILLGFFSNTSCAYVQTMRNQANLFLILSPTSMQALPNAIQPITTQSQAQKHENFRIFEIQKEWEELRENVPWWVDDAQTWQWKMKWCKMKCKEARKMMQFGEEKVWDSWVLREEWGRWEKDGGLCVCACESEV